MIYIQIIDGIRKEHQAVKSKIKGLEDELRVVDTEIVSIQEDLDAATARKDKAYESLMELRKVRDAEVSSHLFKIPHEKNKPMCTPIILFFFYAWAKKQEHIITPAPIKHKLAKVFVLLCLEYLCWAIHCYSPALDPECVLNWKPHGFG